MSINRVQKLLFTEYCDFDDMVLIESPFAQTTRDGKGIRQVHLGLTPTKLVLATDVLPPVEKSSTKYNSSIDPDIETFELIAIYPVECVNLSIFRRRKRQSLKAHFCNNHVFYFELGGFEKRNMFWNLWCEKVKFLCPDDANFSRSETSVVTSTTNSTIYLVDRKEVVKADGIKQLWCKFGTGNSDSNLVKKWTDRYLYLGKNFDEWPLNYQPIMTSPQVYHFFDPKIRFGRNQSKSNHSIINDLHNSDSIQINRFASGVREGCSSKLFLPAENYLVQNRFSHTTDQSSDMYPSAYLYNNHINYYELAENSVKLWEVYKDTNSRCYRTRHRRRYAFSPQPLFLHGLGPWNVTPGARYSIQTKRAVSAVTIRRQPIEPELRLPIAKRQLIATISCEALQMELSGSTATNQITNSQRKPVVFFWTPGYWYRPRSPKDVYMELQTHLRKLRDYHEAIKLKSLTGRRKSLFRKTYAANKNHASYNSDSDDDNDGDDDGSTKRRNNKKRKSKAFFGLFSGRTQDLTTNPARCCWMTARGPDKHVSESSMDYLKRMLRTNLTLTIWEFDSATLACQLTIIDRDLFMKISGLELGVLIWQQSSKNAPNIAALIAFSHRMSCLVATEILKNKGEKLRARLVARFINVASKCHGISNFHSCRTILTGLQTPGIYRLKLTWAYVRKKHATKYQLFEYLCRLYRDPRILIYQKALIFSCQDSPCLPFIGDILAKLLDRIPDYRFDNRGVYAEPISNQKHIELDLILSKPVLSMTSEKLNASSGLIGRLLKSMNIWPKKPEETINSNNQDHEEYLERIVRTENVYGSKALCDYYKPLGSYEDNREQCLMETTTFLKHCQLKAMKYHYESNNLIVDYLLKARYREDRENFFDSFNVEPSDLK